MSVRTHTYLCGWVCVHMDDLGVARYIHTFTKIELLKPTWRGVPRRHPHDAALRQQWRHIRRRANLARLHALRATVARRGGRFLPCALLQIVASYLICPSTSKLHI